MTLQKEMISWKVLHPFLTSNLSFMPFMEVLLGFLGTSIKICFQLCYYVDQNTLDN